MRKAISRREFLSTVAITAAGAVLAACGKKATEATEEAPVVVEAPPTAEPVSINMWGWTDLVNTELVTKFMEKYPNITVNMSDIGDAVFGDQKFLSAVAAGTGPDVAIQNRHTFMQFAAKKLYKEVTSLLETSNMKISDFTPVQIAETSWQGKVFGLPMFTDVRYLYWNKKIYSEVGLVVCH